MTRGGRRAVRLGVGCAAALALVHAGAWFWMTEQVRAGYEATVAAYAAQGWRVTAGPPSRGGWPLAASLHFPGAAVSGPAGGTSWTAERATLRVSLVRPGVVEIIPSGAQTLSLPGLPPVSGEAGRLSIAVPLDGVGPSEVAGSEVAITLAGGRVLVRSVSARVTEAAVVAEARGIALPDPWRRVMEADVDAVAARVLLAPPVPPGATAAERAALWRRAGGTLRIPEFSARWGALDATGSGVLRLDGRLQPEGEAGLRVLGYAEALDGAVRAGLLPARGAVAAKAVLGLLAAPAQGGPVDVPVQAADGVLTVARFPLLRLPDLDWGGR